MGSEYNFIKKNKEKHHEHIDGKYLQVMIQLRKLGLLKKEDIKRYDLLFKLCGTCYYFPEKRFRFLVEWDPSALFHPDRYGCSLLEHVVSPTYNYCYFQIVFEYGIRYQPQMKGIRLLFKKNIYSGVYGDTPFKIIRNRYINAKVMKDIENTLARCYTPSNNTPTINIQGTLLMAGIEENVDLDCVYFLLRRQPDMLKNLLSTSAPVPVSVLALADVWTAEVAAATTTATTTTKTKTMVIQKQKEEKNFNEKNLTNEEVDYTTIDMKAINVFTDTLSGDRTIESNAVAITNKQARLNSKEEHDEAISVQQAEHRRVVQHYNDEVGHLNETIDAQRLDIGELMGRIEELEDLLAVVKVAVNHPRR